MFKKLKNKKVLSPVILLVLLLMVASPFIVFGIMQAYALKLGTPYICCMPENIDELLVTAAIARPHYENIIIAAYDTAAILSFIVLIGTMLYVFLAKVKNAWLNIASKAFLATAALLTFLIFLSHPSSPHDMYWEYIMRDGPIDFWLPVVLILSLGVTFLTIIWLAVKLIKKYCKLHNKKPSQKPAEK
jgi:hypothetical protein